MNILITGAFGFVGTNLSLTLKTPFNCQLIALDVKEPDNHQYDKFYSWNDLDKIDWSQLDIIIHLAGKAHDTIKRGATFRQAQQPGRRDGDYSSANTQRINNLL